MTDSRSGGDGERPRRPADFQASVNRLERAVDDLVSSARSHVSDRATAFIDDTTERLEREFGRRERPAAGRTGSGVEDPLDDLPRRLYRDPRRQKIGGVCAGIARYYGMEPWVVRIIAVTGQVDGPDPVPQCLKRRKGVAPCPGPMRRPMNQQDISHPDDRSV